MAVAVAYTVADPPEQCTICFAGVPAAGYVIGNRGTGEVWTEFACEGCIPPGLLSPVAISRRVPLEDRYEIVRVTDLIPVPFPGPCIYCEGNADEEIVFTFECGKSETVWACYPCGAKAVLADDFVMDCCGTPCPAVDVRWKAPDLGKRSLFDTNV